MRQAQQCHIYSDKNGDLTKEFCMASIYFPIALQAMLPTHPLRLPADQVLEAWLMLLTEQHPALLNVLWFGEQLHPSLYLLLNQQQCSWQNIRQQQLRAEDQLWIIQPLSGG
jgi:hypothetical protein